MQPVEPSFFIRMATPADVQTCHEIDVAAWGAESAASVEMLQARLERWPIGNFVSIDRATGAIIGSVWSVATDLKSIVSWWEASGEGTYAGICNPYGDVSYGVNVSVRPELTGQGLGEALVSRAVEAAWLAGRRWALLGSRIPHYHEWHDILSVDDYVSLTQDDHDRVCFQDPDSGVWRIGPLKHDLRASAAGGRVDPRAWPVSAIAPLRPRVFDGELGFFLGIVADGRRCRVFRPLPEYFPDPDSRNFGVLIGWENHDHPEYGTSKP